MSCREFAEAVEEQGACQHVLCLAPVEASGCVPAHFRTLRPLRQEDRAIDATNVAKRRGLSAQPDLQGEGLQILGLADGHGLAAGQARCAEGRRQRCRNRLGRVGKVVRTENRLEISDALRCSLECLLVGVPYASIEDMKNEREPTPNETAGILWWNSLSEVERAAWLARAGTAVPADAWAAFKRVGEIDRQPRIVD